MNDGIFTYRTQEEWEQDGFTILTKDDIRLRLADGTPLYESNQVQKLNEDV